MFGLMRPNVQVKPVLVERAHLILNACSYGKESLFYSNLTDLGKVGLRLYAMPFNYHQDVPAISSSGQIIRQNKQ